MIQQDFTDYRPQPTIEDFLNDDDEEEEEIIIGIRRKTPSLQRGDVEAVRC